MVGYGRNREEELKMKRLVLVSLIVAACVPTRPYAARPIAAPPGVTDEDLYAASVRVLADRGLALRDKDKDAGLVSTEWEVVDTIIDTKLLHSWRVMISEGEIRLQINCETQDKYGVRSTCSGTHRAEPYLNQVDDIEQQILAEASHRAAKRRQAAEAQAAE